MPRMVSTTEPMRSTLALQSLTHGGGERWMLPERAMVLTVSATQRLPSANWLASAVGGEVIRMGGHPRMAPTIWLMGGAGELLPIWVNFVIALLASSMHRAHLGASDVVELLAGGALGAEHLP